MEMRKALAEHRSSLLAMGGVVGVALGTKRVRGVDTGIPAIVVFVRRKLPASQLKPEAVVPTSLLTPLVPLGTVGHLMATDVVEVGDVKALGLRAQVEIPPSPVKALAENPLAKYRPIIGGISCGRERFDRSGTVGLPLLYRGDVPVLLSNDHVIALSYLNVKPVGGEPVRQPSVGDKWDSEEDYVARLLEWSGFLADSNLMDAAIASLTVDARPELLGLGPYNAIAEPTIGMEVAKSGRSSGVTQGTILYLDAVIQVDYGLPAPFTFEGQVATTPMLIPGDSGSALVRRSDIAVACLGFAGSNLMSFHTPISRIMTRFGLSLLPPGVPVEQGLATIAGKYASVWGYDSRRQKWLLHVPGAPAISDLQVLQQGKGYWLNATEAVTLTYGGDTWSLEAGWNLLGWLKNT